ncbi:conserved Plasmodium membrane protein, unknown function [Plasmodium relictum]|uniref:Apicoplast integral membrane protein n=1 Tax=Plasmodium relictum TaxID=85471 RepID=A0A1J1H6S2_PLARL|nr:conserved Plasmodium membrane protein, unknown function [Plasmodium relictum]CRG99291.1 conserved Plasmodium membrane protein, unknown function [Plasmodium relictum]
MKINTLLVLVLILTVASEQTKTISKIKFKKYKVKNFISINNKNKKYIYLKKKHVKKYVTYFSKNDIIFKIKQIITRNDCLVMPLNIILNLSNIFFFMFSLNYYNLINKNHRNALLEITDNINSKIFLFNTINDTIKNIPNNFSSFLKIFFFSITQFFSQIFISHLASTFFYSHNNEQESEGKKNKNMLCDKLENLKDKNDIAYTEKDDVKLSENDKKKDNESNEISSNKKKDLYSHFLKEQISRENEIDHLNYKEINEINNNIKSENFKNIYNENIRNTILKYMCVLNHTGFIPMFIFNQILKKLNFLDNDVNVLTNFYVLINGFISKVYVNIFLKKNKLIINEKKKVYSLKLIFFNSYTYFIIISLFLKFFNTANFIYEKSIKQILLTFNNILIPSILIIISNIIYEGIVEKSSFYIKDLIFIFNNKYLLYPFFFFGLFYINNHYRFFHIKTSLQLFLLIQSMTPPNYNIFFLNKKLGDFKDIKKILSFSYSIYLIPLYFYSLILYKYFKNKNI